jgi:hypothetical protein
LLAYVFWHRPRPGVDASEYEEGLRALHARLDVPSATFRVQELPFAAAGGYEDWYLVDDWGRLGELNQAAVSGGPREPHDSVAALAGSGWGGIYALVRGDAVPPASARWIDKPAGEDAERFVESLPATTVWRRQMVLGPAPELCLVENGTPGRGREAI